MTPAEAAWVRDNAWTQSMRKTYAEVPGFYTSCACEWPGPCLNANDPGRHNRCHIGTPMYDYETIVCVRGGQGVAAFAEPHRYPTASATGWWPSKLAMVWLTDRRCRWQCVCDCGHPRQDVAHAPGRNPMRPVTYDLVPLFEIAGAS